MAIVRESYVFSGTNGATASSLSLTAPSGNTVGELLVIAVMSDDTGPADEFSINSTNHPGWFKLDEAGSTSNEGTHCAIFYKRCTATETGAHSITVDAASSDEMMGWYCRFSGASAVGAMFDTSETDVITKAPSTSFKLSTQLNILTENTALFICGAGDGGDTHPMGISDTAGLGSNVVANRSGTTGNDVAGVMSYQTYANTGYPGDVSCSLSANDGSSWLIAHMLPAPPNIPRTVTGSTVVVEIDGTNHPATVSRGVTRNVNCATAVIEVDGTSNPATVTINNSRRIEPGVHPILEGCLVWFDLDEAAGNDRADSHTSGLVITEQLGTVASNPSDLDPALGNMATFLDENDNHYLAHESASGTVLDRQGHSTFTLSVRARRTSTNVEERGIVGYGGNPYGQYTLMWGFGADNENLAWFIDDDLGGPAFIRWNGAAQQIDTWYHILAWYDAENDKIGMLVDDILPVREGTAGAGGLDTAGTLNWCLGRSTQNSGGTGMSGDVDQFIMWDRILTADERTYVNTLKSYPNVQVKLFLKPNPATVIKGRVVIADTVVIEVDGTNHPATVETSSNDPRVVTGTTASVTFDGTNYPATIKTDRGVLGKVAKISVEISTGAIVNTTYVDGGTVVEDPLGDWINESQAVDGLTATGSTNVTGQAPGDIGPLKLEGLAVVPETGKALRIVKARIHGYATGINGTTYSVEVKVFSDSELLDTLLITDEASAVWSTPLSNLTKPANGWTWEKFAALNFEVRALGSGGSPEPAVSINVIEVESTHGSGTIPPVVNIPRNVDGATVVVELTSTGAVNKARTVVCSTEVLHLVGSTLPATVNRTRGVICETEAVTVTTAPAVVNKTRFPIADAAIITLTPNAAEVNTERILLGVTEVVSLSPNTANVKADRNVNCAPASVTVTGTLSTVNQGRLVTGATQELILTPSSANLNISRGVICESASVVFTPTFSLISVGANLDVFGYVEVLELDTTSYPASVNTSRNVICATEEVTIDGSNYPALVAFPRVITGLTVALDVDGTNLPATVAASRGVNCATENITLVSTGEVNRGRGAQAESEAVSFTGNAATVNSSRVVTGAPVVVTVTPSGAIVNPTRGIICAPASVVVTTNQATVIAGVNREVNATTAAITLGANDAQTNKSRGALANSESVLITGTLSNVQRNHRAAGETQSIVFTEGAANVNLSRNVSCATEVIGIHGNTATVEKTLTVVRRVIVVT